MTGADQLVPSTWAAAQCRPPSSETSTRSPAAGAASSEPEKTWLATLVTKSVLEAPPSFDSARLVKVRTGGVLSICTVRPADMAPVLPAASVAWAVMRWLPSFSLLLAMRQVPSTATALPSTVPPSYRVTVAPASAVPVKTGMVSAVMLSLSEMPLSELGFRSGTDGAAGASVSKCSTGVVPAPPALPAASVYEPAATVMLALPLSMSVAGVKTALRVRPLPDSAPSVPPLTTTSCSVKLVPGSSLKVKVMVALAPAFSCATSLLMARVGAVVSIVTVVAALAAPTLPAVSVSLAVMAWLPSPRTLLVMVQVPPVATAEPIAVAPSYSVTVAPFSAVPVKVGVLTLVSASALEKPLSLLVSSTGAAGAAGASVSKCSAGVVPAPPALPAGSVYEPAATVMLALPLSMLAAGVNTATRIKPLPDSALSVPPLTTTSSSVKLVPGSSLKLKVMVAVSPAFSCATLLVMARVGATVSST